MPESENRGSGDGRRPRGDVGVLPATPAIHLLEIQKRQFGYAFGGPERSWCDAGPGLTGIDLPVTSAEGGSAAKAAFTGCLKYSTCPLVPDEVKWRPWDQLREADRENLRTIGCYRASRPGWDWDPTALASRRERPSEARWIGNPFGVRTPTLKEISDQIQSCAGDIREHRDLWPCPLGGCVTPEMQRDYRDGVPLLGAQAAMNSWRDVAACPFYYRHSDPGLTVAVKNTQRFAQCYLSLPDLRESLEELGLVVAAPIIRAISPAGSGGESYWYPFYSGFSFLQFPTRNPRTKRRDPLFPLRWIATASARLQTERVHRRLPIGKIFVGAEKGEFLTDWERSQRIVSISDGQATSLLLQWVLLRRLRALAADHAAHSEPVDLTGHVTWSYEPSAGIVARLNRLGFRGELESLQLTVSESGAASRSATLIEELTTLGLLEAHADGFSVTERAHHCLQWLTARIAQASTEHAENGLQARIRPWLEPMRSALKAFLPTTQIHREALDLLADLSVCLLLSAGVDVRSLAKVGLTGWAALKEVTLRDAHVLSSLCEAYEKDVFDDVCRLVPAVHFLVRANMTVPLRWLFVPTATGAESANAPSLVHSGLIVLLEDDLASLPYFSNPAGGQVRDAVLERLHTLLPVLLLVGSIEEEHVRAEHVSAQGQWAVQRDQFLWLRHLLNTVRNLMGPPKQEGDGFVHSLLATLQQSLIVLPEFNQSSSATPLVPVPALGAAKGALDLFHTFYGKRKGTTAVLADHCSPNSSVLVRPLSQTYKSESLVSQIRRATSDLTLLLLDLLLQRASAGETHMTLDLSESASHKTIIFALQLEHPVDETWIWNSSTSLDFWDRGRGFYLSFAISQAVGSRRQAVHNRDDRGIISVDFMRTNL